MLHFPPLDGVCECFAHGLDGWLDEVAVAFGIRACNFGLEWLLAGMNDARQIGLATEVQQQGQSQAGELVAPHPFGLASRGAVTLRFSRGGVEALRQVIVVE